MPFDCPQCGTSIHEKVPFCPHCGARIDYPSPSRAPSKWPKIVGTTCLGCLALLGLAFGACTLLVFMPFSRPSGSGSSNQPGGLNLSSIVIIVIVLIVSVLAILAIDKLWRKRR